MDELIETALQIEALGLEGDVIPRGWWSAIRRENHPDQDAILLLSWLCATHTPRRGPSGDTVAVTSSRVPLSRLAARYGLSEAEVAEAFRRLHRYGFARVSKAEGGGLEAVPIPSEIAEISGPPSRACVAPSRERVPASRGRASASRKLALGNVTQYGAKPGHAVGRNLFPSGGAASRNATANEAANSLPPGPPEAARSGAYYSPREAERGPRARDGAGGERERVRALIRAFCAASGRPVTASRESEEAARLALSHGIVPEDVPGIVRDMLATFSNPHYLTFAAFCRQASTFKAGAPKAPEVPEEGARAYRTAEELLEEAS